MKYCFFNINSFLLFAIILLTNSVNSQQHLHNLQQQLKEKTGQQLRGHNYEIEDNPEILLDGHPLLFEILEEKPENKINERINNPNIQLFQKYLGKGLFTCSAKYIEIIQQLNRIIMSAHKEYSECQQKMSLNNVKDSDEKISPKFSAQLEMIRELLNDN
ncbi:hypothetical protein Mgra_00007717 [Meloidogyne graminicola]|uniref:Secreted protein n=1 Tax=Meloidogyne graminicola TaxID=189291 RepID=A0A8S9ZHR3_9BILA|nr:hypothetical protein Mgra_00007717 [Meloidogyne graminicola]